MTLFRLPPRWVALLIFTLVSALSFLDRQLLAAFAPALMDEFHLSSRQYGWIVAAFSLTYAASAPAAGWFVDRVNLDRGITSALGLWSLAGIATGFTTGFPSLLACRAWLGLAQSANIPASGKAVGLYLQPAERPLGSAMGQIGISLGMIAAPLLAGSIGLWYGWRAAFIVAGAIGFLWIPLWWAVARRVPRNPATPGPTPSSLLVWRDRRLWALVAANVLGMSVYSLWMNWTTLFLVKNYSLTQQEANLRFAWIPPVFAAAGGLAGGAIALRLARSHPLLKARFRGALGAAIALLVTGITPLLPGVALSTAAICWSFFWAVAFSVNIYALPVDYFGAERAATGVSALTFAYGAMQTVTSPLIGAALDRYGFVPVCTLIAFLPLAACGILYLSNRKR